MLPIVEALREDDAVELEFAGDSEVGHLLQSAGLVESAISSEDLPLWRTITGTSTESLDRWDLIVGERALLSGDLRGLPFETRVDDKASVPASRQLFERFRQAWHARFGSAPHHDGRLRLRIPRADARTDRTRAPQVWIHAGAGSRRKVWPAMSRELPRLLAERRAAGWACTVSFGPADTWIRDALGPLPSGTREVTGISLTDLAHDVARAATVFLGHDSGPGHLAAALGVPTLTLYGPASTMSVWQPYGDADSTSFDWTRVAAARLRRTITSALDRVARSP